MTGEEHYREAERLLASAQNVEAKPAGMLTHTECAHLAQVHATLAQAAATWHVDKNTDPDLYGGYPA